MQSFNSLTYKDIIEILFEYDSGRDDGQHGVIAQFRRLPDERAFEMARYGIERYVYYSRKLGTRIDPVALTEIIKDARKHISIAMILENEKREALALDGERFTARLANVVARFMARSTARRQPEY